MKVGKTSQERISMRTKCRWGLGAAAAVALTLGRSAASR